MQKVLRKMEDYTSALQCKKTDFDKLYCVRNPIALLQVEHHCCSEKKLLITLLNKLISILQVSECSAGFRKYSWKDMTKPLHIKTTMSQIFQKKSGN